MLVEQTEESLVATVVTYLGYAIITKMLSGGVQAVPDFCAFGTGAGTAAATDTALFTEIGAGRVTGTPTQQTTTQTNDTFQVVGTLTAGSALAITNAGLFDASTSGNLFLIGDFAVINLASGDTLTLTAKTQIT